MKFLIVLVALVCAVQSQETYNRLMYEDCGSKEFSIVDVSVSPMPVLQPGEATLKLKAKLKRAITGKLNVKLDIVRTVSRVPLPIRCYKVSSGGLDFYVGSCEYDDLCVVLKKILPTFTPDNCPPKLREFGIDCNCPLNVKAGDLEVDEKLVLPDAGATVANWLSSGNFDVTLDTRDNKGPYACLKIKFSVKPSK